MKILVTGTAGFIGFHLANALIARGDEVVGIDNINDYYDVNLKYARLENAGITQGKIRNHTAVKSIKYDKYTFIKMDLVDADEMNALFTEHKFDCVCNLAAQAGVRYSIENPRAYIDSNVVGFMNILESCRHHKIEHLVYASSSSVYGLNKKVPFSTAHPVNHPVSLYAASKKSNELMAHTYSHLYNLPTTGLRFFTVYGTWGRPDMAYFLFTDAILNDKPIKVFNHGKMSRDFTYVDDIVEGIIRVIDNPPKGNESWNPKEMDAATSPAPYTVYNIGNNAPVNLLEFIETIEDVLEQKAEKNMMSMQPGDVEITYADVTRLIDNLGYKPKTTIKEGITAFVKWYKAYYGKK
jgi:UDP-glucuronate 4-epimerase